MSCWSMRIVFVAVLGRIFAIFLRVVVDDHTNGPKLLSSADFETTEDLAIFTQHNLSLDLDLLTRQCLKILPGREVCVHQLALDITVGSKAVECWQASDGR